MFGDRYQHLSGCISGFGEPDKADGSGFLLLSTPLAKHDGPSLQTDGWSFDMAKHLSQGAQMHQHGLACCDRVDDGNLAQGHMIFRDQRVPLQAQVVVGDY